MHNKEVNFKAVLKHLQGFPEDNRIITTSIQLNELLIKNGKNSMMLNAFLPNMKVEHAIYLDAKKILESYKKIFRSFTFKNIELFGGIDFQLLLQLQILLTIKKILEDNKNTIFIFERFYPIYFAVPKLSLDLGYKTEMKIGLFNGGKMEFINCSEEKATLNYVKKYTRKKAVNFVTHSFGEGFSQDRLKTLIRFACSAISLNVKKFGYRLKVQTKVSPLQTILKSVDTKIKNINNKNITECALFITAVRLDMHLHPILPVLEKFELENKNCLIFTTDLSTSLALKNEKILFVNLFEEVNLLKEQIKRSDDGLRLDQQIKELIRSDNLPYGISYIQGDLLNKLFRTMAIISIIENIFEKIKLKSLIVAPTGEMFENLGIEISKKFNITSYSMIPGVNAATISAISDLLRADKIFVNGIQGMDVLNQLGYDKKRIEVTGNPKYDFFKTIDSRKARIFLEKVYHIDRKKNFIVIAMSRWHKDDEMWIANLIKFCNKNNFEIVIKLHPRYKINARDLSEEKIKNIKNRCKNLKFLISYDIGIPTLLSATDLLITDFSNVGLDAILLEKPVLSVNFTNIDINENVRYSDYGASLSIQDYESLEKIILEIFNDSKHLDELRKGRMSIIERYNFRNDGLATDRIYEILTR